MNYIIYLISRENALPTPPIPIPTWVPSLLLFIQH